MNEVMFLQGDGKPLGILNTPGLTMTTSEGALTLEDFMRAVKAVEEEPLRPHLHEVSPDGVKRLADGGRTCCHSCGQILSGHTSV